MSNSRHIALSLALVATLALAAQRVEASVAPGPDDVVPALSSDRDGGDGRPPTPGPTNPGPLF